MPGHRVGADEWDGGLTAKFSVPATPRGDEEVAPLPFFQPEPNNECVTKGTEGQLTDRHAILRPCGGVREGRPPLSALQWVTADRTSKLAYSAPQFAEVLFGCSHNNPLSTAHNGPNLQGRTWRGGGRRYPGLDGDGAVCSFELSGSETIGLTSAEGPPRREGLKQPVTGFLRQAAQKEYAPMKASLFLFAVLVAVAGINTQADAQNYPWCAKYSGTMGGARNCGFSTYEQCMATVSGVTGYCARNMQYVPSVAMPGPRTHAQRRRHYIHSPLSAAFAHSSAR